MNIPTWFLDRVQRVWNVLKHADRNHEVWLLSSGEFACTSRQYERDSALLVGTYTKAITVESGGFATLAADMWLVWQEIGMAYSHRVAA